MTLDILICSLNKGIVRIDDLLRPEQDGVRYVVSYQYTDERYLELVPDVLKLRKDVVLSVYKGRGLSDEAPAIIEKIFSEDPDLDVAFFRASTYTGKMLKQYPEIERQFKEVPTDYDVSTIEMVFRREKVQNQLLFDERFGLGTKFLTCGEEEIWLIDALRAGLKIKYFPERIVETSTMRKRSMIYVDAGVQRSKGALCYYKYGSSAWMRCFAFAFNSARRRLCHFFPMLRHLYQGIRYVKRH